MTSFLPMVWGRMAGVLVLAGVASPRAEKKLEEHPLLAASKWSCGPAESGEKAHRAEERQRSKKTTSEIGCATS